jgi:hypothetical protein
MEVLKSIGEVLWKHFKIAIEGLIFIILAVLILFLPIFILCSFMTNPVLILIIGISIGLILMIMFVNIVVEYRN